MSNHHSTAARHTATTFGLGDLLPAPGTTAGSLPAALVWWGLTACLPSPAARLTATTVLVTMATVAGIWAAGVEAERRGSADPGPVVIDEVAGQWLTYLLALPYLSLAGWQSLAGAVALGFFLFRLFDIAKPWPVNRLEHLPGGLGIMADDLAAGIYAGASLIGIAHWTNWI
jgi:phosphatidylglycerophosphatase A